MTGAVFSYDAIAEVYATDMGQSMPFDDVGWYRALCQAHPGRALELGCGTGRILLELLASGVDICGVDRSLPMLRRLCRDAAARGLDPNVAQMDLRDLALTERFRVILAPYSLITYVIDPASANTLLQTLRGMLAEDGLIVLDVFVPQPLTSFADYRLDYRRPHGSGTLERHKRIHGNADGTNRIERRYRIYASNGDLTEEFFTQETILPYSPKALAALADSAGLHIDAWTYDYATRPTADGARFATVVLSDRSAGC